MKNPCNFGHMSATLMQLCCKAHTKKVEKLYIFLIHPRQIFLTVLN